MVQSIDEKLEDDVLHFNLHAYIEKRENSKDIDHMTHEKNEHTAGPTKNPVHETIHAKSYKKQPWNFAIHPTESWRVNWMFSKGLSIQN